MIDILLLSMIKQGRLLVVRYKHTPGNGVFLSFPLPPAMSCNDNSVITTAAILKLANPFLCC